MNRPLERPVTPLTMEQIWKNTYQHFVIDKMPRCADNDMCFYNQTGCAVGMHLTMEDANIFNENNMSIRLTKINLPLIYQIYFDKEDITEQLLVDLQRSHDNWVESYGDFSEYMKGKLEQIKMDHNI